MNENIALNLTCNLQVLEYLCVNKNGNNNNINEYQYKNNNYKIMIIIIINLENAVPISRLAWTRG